MFGTILAAQRLLPDLCATVGKCASVLSPRKDPVSSAEHVSTAGIYSAGQVRRYRECSNDYQSKFDPVTQFDVTTHSFPIVGYTPINGKKEIEPFRVCWEELSIH
jgi:hypothetical protein